MKKYVLILISFLVLSCGEPPIQFSEAALNEDTITLNGESILLKDVLENYKGKTILIDVWASWCGDCITGLPTVKILQNEFPDVEFVFLSVDRNEAAWKRGIEKYGIKGHHYFITKGQRGALGDFLNSNWIPRYMVIDKEGIITLYKAKKATDKRIKEALNN